MATDWDALIKKAKKKDTQAYQKLVKDTQQRKTSSSTAQKAITAPERKTITSKTVTAPTVTTGKKRGSGLVSRMDELPSPVKKYTPPVPAAKSKEKNDRTWFKPSSYLADGSRDKGDITKAILGTVVDAGEHIVTSVPRMAETGLDALAMIGTAMSKADTAKANFNMVSSPFAVTKKGSEYAKGLADMNTVLQKEQQKNTVDFVKKDIIDEEAVAKKIIGTPFEKHTGINVDEASVLGDKSGSAIQSAGQMLTSIGLQAAGVPMPLTMGLSAFGSQSEKALNEGANFEQAAMSAAVSAGAEVLSEYLSGGIKVKLPGQAASQTLDDILIKPFTEEISNKVLKSLANIGIDAVGEGFEEIFSGVVSNLGEALYKEENIGELIGSKEALDEYIESFIAGMALGGGSSTVNAVAGRNNIELSENEQKVFDSVVENIIAEEKEAGNKVDGKKEKEIRKAVLNDMLKGAIDTDTIESVLGGDTYKTYKETADREADVLKRFEELGNKANATLKEQAEFKSVSEMAETLKNNPKSSQLKVQLSEEVSALVKDSRLSESYNEKARRRQSFEADLTKYNAKQQETVKKAIESGILNNTRRTHDFVDMIAKISADKGVSFDFTSNQKLKESGFAIEGKTVNGYVTKDGIKINVNSAKALNSVVGHEITHILEGTELYSELQTMLKAVAESKGEYQARYDEISKLYEGIEGADIEKELTADLVGDYLFTDSDFVNRLSAEKPGVFKKIFDEIKYLCRVAASGSKEAKELEKVKKTFEELYRESRATAPGETKYSMAGIKSKTHNLTALEQAERLEDVGKATSEEIRQQTGWFKGYDGQWRYEIDDSKMKIRDIDITSGETKLSEVIDHPELFEAYPQLKDITVSAFPSIFDFGTNGRYNPARKEISLNSDFLVNTKVDKEIAQIRESTEYISYKNRLEEAAKAHGEKRLKLSKEFKAIRASEDYTEYIDSFFECENKEQEKAVIEKWERTKDGKRYEVIKAELARMDKENPQIEIENEFRESETGKRYHELLNNIDTAEVTDNTRTRNILIHEIQHAIQDIEGFANGSSPEFWKKAPAEKKPGTLGHAKAKREKIGNEILSTTSPEFIEAFRAYNRGDIEYSDIEKGPYSEDELELLWDYDEADREVSYLMSHGEKSDESFYFSTAGEIEARDVSQRMEYTAEQRKHTRPDIDRTDVVFADGGVSNDIKIDTEGNKFVEVDEKLFNPQKGESHASTIARIIKDKFNNLITVNGQKIQINKDTNREWRFSGAARKLLQGNPVAYDDKLKTIPNADEILKAAKKWVGEEKYHSKNPDIVEFARGNVLYRVGNNGYIADVIVGIKKNNSAVLYDLVNIQGKKITEAPVTMASINPQRRQNASVTNNVTHSTENVKQDGSFSLSAENTAPKKHGDYNIYGEDVMLEGETKSTSKREFTAPTRENIAEKKKAKKDKLFPMLDDDIPVSKDTSDTDANINSNDTTPTRDKAVLIERYKKRAEVQLVAEKEALKEIYDQRKAELYEEIKDKNAFISKKAKEFYDEISSLRKGVKASKELGYFLDFGFEWSELKSTLLKISKWPDTVINPASSAESIIREAIIRDYEDKSAYGFDDLDTEYSKKVAQLEADTIKRIEEYKAREFTRSGLHTKIVDGIKAKFTEKGFDLDKVLSEAKNLSTFSTVDNTPQRVMEKALGYKPGQILADATVNKVAQNESESIKWLNSFTDRKNGILAEISKKYNIKPGSKESAGAQMYAEGFYVNEKNEIIKYGEDELTKDFPDVNVRERIKGLANDEQIRQIYDETLEAINAARSRNLYPEIQRLDNYFLHFRAMEDTFSRLGLPFNPNDIRAKDLPTDLNGVTADLKPGQPYFASAKHREGKRTTFDLLGGLERYLTSAKNQIYHIDDIQNLRALRNYIADSFGQAKGLGNLDSLSEEEAQERIEQVYGSHLSTFAKFLNEEANVLAGKTTLIDRGLEGIIGRRGISFLNTVNSQVGSNMVGFNISSSLTNILPVVQTAAKTNKGDFVKALAQTASDKLNSLKGKSDGFKENSPVIIRRKGADRFYRTPYQKFGDTGYILMSAVDDVSTEIIARTKYNELTRKGMEPQQAHFETDKWVSRLMGDRSLGQMPQLYNSKLLGVITKFQLEVRNQLDSMFYDTVQEAKVSTEEIENKLKRNAKTAAKVSKTFFELAVLQHGFGRAFEQVAGYNPAFDIIEVLIKTFGLDDDEDDEDTVLDNIEEGFFALLEDLPYTSTLTGGRIPISSALPINELINGKDQYGNEKSRGKTLADAVPYYLLPTGFGQIKKTAKGLKMFGKDLPIAGSYTDSGNLRFPVEKTPGNVLQAAVFGQYANKNAQSYFDEGYAPLKEKQIQEFKDVGIPIADYWKYREGLSGLKTLNEQGDYIGSLDLPTEKKNILINNIADRKTPIDMSDYDKFPDFEVFDFAKKNPELYKVLQKEGISVREYKEKHEKNAFMRTDDFSWAANNPEKYTLSRAVTDSVTSYRDITSGLYDIRADKDKYGKSISGSAKRKKKEYIWSLDIDEGAKCILFRNEYKSDDTYNGAIINYLNGRNDISYEDKKTILTELDFKIDDKGRITWD